MINSGFESETDTEEFEKVGQSPIDRQRTDVTTTTTAVTVTTVSSQFHPKPETASMSTSTECNTMQDAATLTEVRLNTNPECYSNNTMMTNLMFDHRFLTASHFLNNNELHQSLITVINATTLMPLAIAESILNPLPLSPASPTNDTNIPYSIQSHNNNIINITENKRCDDTNHKLSPIPECDSPAKCQQQRDREQQHSLNSSMVDTDASTVSDSSNSIGICEKFRSSEFQSCPEDGDSEFVHSEFYIDESLPSSMTISDQMVSNANGVQQQNLQSNGVTSDMGADDCSVDTADDLQQLIAEIEIFSFDSCQNNDDKILMLLQVLLPLHV